MNSDAVKQLKAIVEKIDVLREMHLLTAYIKPEEEATKWRFELNAKIEPMVQQMKKIIDSSPDFTPPNS
jgi:ribosomal protein S21